MDSVTFTKEPFALNSLFSWSSDRRTRVIVFALNFQVPDNNDFSSITADAEDSSHRHYVLKVEYAAAVPGQPWMSTLTLRLSDDLTDVGDVLLRIVQQGRQSNRVRMGIGHVGGGLADDVGARPTSPFLIHGAVRSENAPFPEALLKLIGNGAELTVKPNSKGEYLIATVGGDYILSAAATFYDFTPPSRTFINLDSALEGIDFNASRQKRAVSVVLNDDRGKPIPNVGVKMTGSDASERTLYSDNAGSVGFVQILAGYTYAVAPLANTVFTFPEQTIDPLADDTTVTITGARRLYTVSGQALERGAPISGATVKATESGASTITDSAGNFSLPLAAGLDYTITIEKDEYVFEPPQWLINAIETNRQISFSGHPHVFLTGRVVDPNGRGIYGVKLDVGGTESGSTRTDINGNYSFLVTSFGNYSVTPSKEQDYYSFTPVMTNLSALKDSRIANFSGSFNASVSPSYVLEFDGAPKSVDYSMTLPGPDYNLFWPDGENYGHFFWEFWAMPAGNAAATYMISDGYGGAHAILFGVANFESSEPNRYELFGNVWNGSFLTSFASDEGPAPNEWGHFAVGWDGATVVIYFNGVPVGKKAFVGPRITPGGIQGCGRLLIGGSDHSNWVGRIAQIRGFERRNPLEAIDNGVFSSFAPETVFSIEGNMLSYFFRPAENIADLSLYGQYGRQHPGLVRSTANGVLYPCTGCPLPQFVVDPTAPDFAHPAHPGTLNTLIDHPATAPAGALVFDSFSRANSTYVLSGLGGLGLTESGSAGHRTWFTNVPDGQRQPFGLLNGRAVLLANSSTIVWTDTPTAGPNLDVRVDRHPGLWGTGHNTGLSFRISDPSNYFFAYTSGEANSSQPQTLTIGFYNNGARTDLASGIALPAGWTTLRVVTKSDGTLSVYADGSQVYSTNNTFLASSTGAGLYNNGPGLALTNRWDNFTIFTAP